MVQAAEMRKLTQHAMALHGSSQRSILVQGQVRPKPVVVVGIFAQQFAQMALIDDDQMIQAFPSDRSDQALNISVLPRRTRCSWSIPNSHGVQPLLEDLAKGAVTIANKMARRPVPGKGFGDLMRKPFCRRMRGHADMDQLSSSVMQTTKPNSILNAIVGTTNRSMEAIAPA